MHARENNSRFWCFRSLFCCFCILISNDNIVTLPNQCKSFIKINGASGELLSNEIKEKKIEIKIEGNCAEVKTDAGNITVEGNVEGDASSDAGNITVRGDIKGNAKTDCGNIKAHHIFGNANTDCGNINGASKLWNHGSSINSNSVTVCNTKGLFKNLMSKLDFFNE